jgi:hypothetical protein
MGGFFKNVTFVAAAAWALVAMSAGMAAADEFSQDGERLIPSMDGPVVTVLYPRIDYAAWGWIETFPPYGTRQIVDAVDHDSIALSWCPFLSGGASEGCDTLARLAVPHWIFPFRSAARHGNCGQLTFPLGGGPLSWGSKEVRCA